MATTITKKRILHNDDYFNTIIGHGLQTSDPMRSTKYFARPIINDQYLATFYLNALARRIVDMPADEAVKSGFFIKEDVENKAIQMLDDLDWENKASDALRWSRLFGRSVITMLINDGCRLEDPVDLNNIKEIESLKTYDKREVVTSEWVINQNPDSKNYGMPEIYRISPAGKTPFYIHHTRVLSFDGEPLPNQERIARGGCGLSVLQGLIESITTNEHGHNLASKILERLSQPVLSIEDLLEKLATDEDEQVVKNYLHLLDMTRSVLNMIAIDKTDTFELHNIPITGIDSLLDKFGQHIAALSDIPFSILFGRSPTGLQATGEADLKKYYGMVERLQKRRLKPHLDKIVKYLQLAKNGLFEGRELENWKIEFNPLWSPSEKEQAETNKLNAEADKTKAEADKIYFDLQIVDSLTIRDKLILDGRYNFKTDDISLNEGLGDDDE